MARFTFGFRKAIELMAIPYLANPSPCMQKLDRLKWTDGFCFSAYGARVGVRVSDNSVLPAVKGVLPPGIQFVESPEVEGLVSFQVGGPGSDPRQKRFHLVYAEVDRIGRTHDLDEALHAVESSIQLFVSFYSPERVFVHAGCVAWKGRAILLPGRSFAGKSTLVAALLRAGAEYYSDEFAVLDDRGYVHPYPRRLSLRDGVAVPRVRATAADLGSRDGVEPLPIGAVVVTHYEVGAHWSPRAISPGKAVLALLDNTVAIRRRPQQCLAAIERVASSARCVAGNRGEADETAERLLAACA